MNLPQKIFFTGVPGSRWSGIAQTIESIPGFNISDRSLERSFSHNGFTGHKGAYFGRLMEFEARLDSDYLSQAWAKDRGTKLIKSHDWAYSLDRLKDTFPMDWIMLVYRPDQASFDWWKQAGGFNINYPSYTAYQNDEIMRREISWQNQAILKFAKDRNLTWDLFTSEWIQREFNYSIRVERTWPDIQVAILK
jgi:hypothetical protein